MPTYYVTARKTTPMTPISLEARSREEAIAHVIAEGVDEGGTVEVLQCVELQPGEVSPGVPGSGITGTTGVTGASGPSGPSGPSGARR